MGVFITVIMKHQDYIYLFDSHRNKQGLRLVGGTSVILKFSDLQEVEKYIQVFYLEYKTLEQSYFQLQFVRINIDILI